MAFVTVSKLFSMPAILTNNEPDDTQTMNIVIREFITEDFIKQKPIFACWLPLQIFSIYRENTFSFEKQIWTFYKAWRALYSVIANHPMVIRVPLTGMDRIHSKAESSADLSIEGKVFQFLVTRMW